MRLVPLVALGTLASVLALDVAAAQERLPRECRREIVQLCGRDRSQMLACLIEKRDRLSAKCAAELRERVQARAASRGDAGPRARVRSGRDFELVTYGPDPRQAIDYYPPAADAAAAPPLVLFIHGGGWSFGNRTQTVQAKPDYFRDQGYAFASTGYRVLPDAPVEEQARDVARAIAKLRSDAARLGFDPDRIVLIGHSAGAHLAALVATDPQFAGSDMAAIKGVILLDGAGYDVPAQMTRADGSLRRIYRNAFGTDPARQVALSPISHVGAPDAPDWLILYVADRVASREQSLALSEALARAGASSTALAISDTDHGRLNRELGTEAGAEQTRAVGKFLASLF